MKKSTGIGLIIFLALVGGLFWLLGESSPKKLERSPAKIPVELPKS